MTTPTPTGRLAGKIAVVTGGGSGYGAGIVKKFLAEGAKVIIADFSVANGENTASELGCEFIKADVSRRSDWEAVLKLALEKFHGVDIVVNNAGASYANKIEDCKLENYANITHVKPTMEVQETDFDLCMNVNARALFHCAAIMVPVLLNQGRGGSLIQIASTAVKRPRPGLTWYSASKAAASVATKSMAVEYGPAGIRFNTINPVVGGTGMTHLFLGKADTPENRKEWLSTIPLGRFCQPSDVGNACCYLASDEGAFITGVDMEVDGGRCV